MTSYASNSLPKRLREGRTSSRFIQMLRQAVYPLLICFGRSAHRPQRPGTARGSVLRLVIVANLVIVGWTIGSTLLPRAAPAAEVAAAPPPNGCADAVERVQAYQAPGQREPLTDAIAANLAAEGLRRPV